MVSWYLFICSLAALPAPEEPPLSLQRAVELALETHPTARIVDARDSRARAERRLARSDIGPGLSATGSYTRRSAEVLAGMGDEQRLLQARDGLRAQATAQIPIIAPSGVAGLVSAGTGLEAQRLEGEETRRALAFAVSRAFLAVLAERQLVDAAALRLERAEDALRVATTRTETGLGTPNDVTRARLEQASARLELVTGQGAARAAASDLALMLGLEELPPMVEPDLATPEEDRATSPAVEALRLRSREAHQQATAAWLGLLPQVDAFASTSATNEPGWSGRYMDWQAGLSGTWTLMSGGARAATAARYGALAMEYQAAADDESIEQERAREAATLALDTARVALEVAYLQLAVAERNAREIEERFVHGLASALEAADASASAFQAAADLARQRYDAWQAALSMADALGLWPQEAVR